MFMCTIGNYILDSMRSFCICSVFQIDRAGKAAPTLIYSKEHCY